MSLPHSTRRLRDGRLVHGGIAEIFPDWAGAAPTGDAAPDGESGRPCERWLFVSPHDDDPAVAAGLAIALGVAAGARIRVRIVTDGRMGYTPSVSADDVVSRRREETFHSFSRLGVEDIGWYDYPDTQLPLCVGRRRVRDTGDDGVRGTVAAPEAHVDEYYHDAPHAVAGFTGLQNSFVSELRRYRPTRLFLLSAADYHPDHKTVHQEMMISLFHAQGDIWPELGPPIEARPWVHEVAAYRPFPEPPDICLRADEATFRGKLDAIAAFASQTQIDRLVQAVRRAGPVEYVRSYRFETYDPATYATLFEGEE